MVGNDVIVSEGANHTLTLNLKIKYTLYNIIE